MWKLGAEGACCRAGGTECSSACMGSFEGGGHYLHYLHHSLAPVKSRDGTQLHPSTENWIKDLLSMAPPIRTRPSSPSVSLSHQEAFISLLSFSNRGQTDWLVFCDCGFQSDPMDRDAPRLLCPRDFPGKNTGVGCHALLQGNFPTQGSNTRLLHLLHWQMGSLSLVPSGSP